MLLKSPISSFLAYIEHFNIIFQAKSLESTTSQGYVPEHSTKMYVLQRSSHANGKWMGDINSLSHIRTAIYLILCFMEAANP
jgi:hypothetical protein